MRLYLFRHIDEIPVETMNFAAVKTTEVLGVDPVVFEEPLNMEITQTDISSLLKISDSFLERGEPVVAVVFTNESLMEEDILGEGSERNRGVWVRSTGDLNKTFLAYLHELCHVFEADHCARRECLMYPFYTPRTIENISLENLLCDSCLRSVRESWVYSRLLSSTKARKREGRLQPEIVSSAPVDKKLKPTEGIISEKEQSPGNRQHSFPDWSLPREEFIRQVKEFFQYED